MKRLNLSFVCFLLLILSASANDGVYLMSGNFLVPTEETDISVKKEILTITIGKDSLATVDVYYELMNNGDAKTVTMAFEAEAPYNAATGLRRDGKHPYIKSFTVTMNDQSLPWKNAVVARRFNEQGMGVDFTPLDLTQWKGMGELPDSLVPCDNTLYNATMDSTISFAYGYFFKAPFQTGLNKVHHTYSFVMSYTVAEKFRIDYWLTPATRWANHQVDDFTLRIKAEESVKDFCMVDSVFSGAPFRIVNGDGEIHQMKVYSGEHYAYVNLGPNAMLEWHKNNFCPKSQMAISGADYILKTFGYGAMVVIDPNGVEYRYVGDCGDTYFVTSQDYAEIPKKGCRVVEYAPERGQGWVFPNRPGHFNVRRGPSIQSSVLTIINYEEGELPEAYRCLGHVQQSDGSRWWFRIKIGDKTGYVSAANMDWDAINTF